MTHTYKICKDPTIIGLKELRLHTDKYINAVAKGETFVVVKRTKPIFKIIPPTS